MQDHFYNYNLLAFAAASVALAFAVGCAPAQEHEHASGPVQPSHTSAFHAPLAVQPIESLNLPPLECQSPQACPQAVGELVGWTSRGPLHCTATLVAPRIVLTASHCVPKENLSADRKFNGNCWVRWPANPQARKGSPRDPINVPCERLLAATPLGPESRTRIYPDHALIQIASPQDEREPMAIASQERTFHEKADSALLYGVNPAPGAHVIEFQHCRRDDSFEVPEKLVYDKGTLIFPSCRVLHGFSGGPILSPLSRTIIGVISGIVGFDPKNPEKPVVSIGTRAGPWSGLTADTTPGSQHRARPHAQGK